MFTDVLIVSVLAAVNSDETHLSASKVFRSNWQSVNLKPQTNTADKGVLML